MEFGGKFDAGGASADDGEVEEAVAFLWGGCREGGLFEVGENALADAARVGGVFEKVGMLGYAWDAECLGV